MAGTKPKKQRWYLGGFAGSGAVLVTHPLDLLKVHLQTQQQANKTLRSLAVDVVRNDGVLGLYSGISASIMRQMTYTTIRFGLYETISSKLLEGRSDCLPFYQKALIGCFSGFIGGIAGNPSDMVNVRMQNDMKLPKELRRNYSNVFTGLYRVVAEDGFRTLFAGVTMTASRGLLITLGQVAVYDQIKQILISTGYVGDTPPTHLVSSVIAGTVATVLTQPFDVMKTRLMNAKPGEYNGVKDCAGHLFKVGGVGAFYKGFIPAWIRLSPQTIVTWLLLEQLRKAYPIN